MCTKEEVHITSFFPPEMLVANDKRIIYFLRIPQEQSTTWNHFLHNLESKSDKSQNWKASYLLQLDNSFESGNFIFLFNLFSSSWDFLFCVCVQPAKMEWNIQRSISNGHTL